MSKMFSYLCGWGPHVCRVLVPHQEHFSFSGFEIRMFATLDIRDFYTHGSCVLSCLSPAVYYKINDLNMGLVLRPRNILKAWMRIFVVSIAGKRSTQTFPFVYVRGLTVSPFSGKLKVCSIFLDREVSSSKINSKYNIIS